MSKLVIGICGKPCSGKSFLSDMITRDLLIDCDKLSRQIFDENLHIIKIMMDLDHTPTPKDVADIVFGNKWYMFKRKRLYKRFTTFMWHEVTERIKEILETTNAKTILIDAPLLKEAKLDKLCDTIITVDTKFTLRLERAKERGWTAEELKRRDSYFRS